MATDQSCIVKFMAMAAQAPDQLYNGRSGEWHPLAPSHGQATSLRRPQAVTPDTEFISALGFDRIVCFFEEILIGLLGILLGSNSFCLHGLRIAENLLNQTDHAATGSAVLVCLEAWRRRRADWLLSLRQGCTGGLLTVEILQDA